MRLVLKKGTVLFIRVIIVFVEPIMPDYNIILIEPSPFTPLPAPLNVLDSIIGLVLGDNTFVQNKYLPPWII